MTELKKYKYLFLDRDGVINVERKADYVKNISEWVFEDNVLEAINILTERFERIFIVTNQRGVGRGKMSNEDLDKVHGFMLEEIANHGGKISSIYFCTDINPSSINRKPNIGMAYKAQADFPDINFEESIMVGNSKSDIVFGKKAGMFTVLVGNKYPASDKIYKDVNMYCKNLHMFALLLTEKGKK